MLAMITQQGLDQYAHSTDTNIITYLTTSAMELTSMSSLVLVMSFVTEDMLTSANSGSLSTTELMHEIFAGLVMYANHIDALADTDLLRLGRKLRTTPGSDYFPGLGQQITINEPMETHKFAMAQIAATTHLELVHTRIGRMVSMVLSAQAYVPSSTDRRHMYPADWEAQDMAGEAHTDTFATEREQELDKLNTIANRVAKMFILVAIQKKYPNECVRTVLRIYRLPRIPFTWKPTRVQSSLKACGRTRAPLYPLSEVGCLTSWGTTSRRPRPPNRPQPFPLPSLVPYR
jgi:hypothetical protein